MNVKKNIVKIFCIFLMCMIAIIGKNEYSQVLLRNATYGMPALIEKMKVDDLYIGSSMFRQGIDINTLENDGKSSYVLAYNGNQPALEYYELQNLINNGVSINNLYIDMYAYSAWKDPSVDDEKIFLEMDLKSKIVLYRLLSDNKIQPQKIWQMFVSSNNELLLFWPINSYVINSQFRDGGTLTHTQGADKTTLVNSSIPEIEGKMNSIQKQYLINIIELAKKNKINLLFIETPKYYTIANNTNYLECMKQYAKLLDTFEVSYLLSETTAEYVDDFTLDNGKSYSFDSMTNEYYMDSIHLSSKGREIFTKTITNYSCAELSQ